MEMYVDDIVVFGQTSDECLTNVRKVLQTAEPYGLQIKWAKSRPLTQLLKKDAAFVMGVTEQQAVQKLKAALTQDPVLKIFKQNGKTQLHVDASKHGFGATLVQQHESKWHPVFYWSRKTSPQEGKLHSYFLEVKAAYLATKRLRHYLMGIRFDVITDCAAFKQTAAKKDVPREVVQWLMYLQDFDFNIEHRSADRMKHVDTVSRYPVMVIESHIKAKIRKAQQNDEHLKAVTVVLEQKPYADYVLKNGVLFKQLKGLELLVAPRNFCKVNKIEHIAITTGVPRGNGQIERVNRLAKLSANNSAKWYNYTAMVQKAINAHVHTTTKFTPYEIMFGVKMRNEMSADIIKLLQDEMLVAFQGDRSKLREEARINIQAVQEVYKRNFDRRRKSSQGYQKADLVAIKVTQFSDKKLGNKFIGPYSVVKDKGNGRYEVEKAADFAGPHLTSTSVDNMKLWAHYAAENDGSSGTDDEQDDRM
ncbi:uncharacterized protein LOC128870341 [Anastrepha ludens]|uniref:uncharacterized protein LOC128870341 n=1 Tax=Anastrepha ludens TaxID=28586 RepID=UPI0023B1F98A|nr:uncharacterized protein LOC128870341 [Anastrepha ludens]